ncbi:MULTISPECIES: hypothetical protein [unclassified Spiroplasma]|uniref:hypothetical protein n=1 Tax=unclassified Spiroplasma TaxID=2637901 RepID=UPI00313E3831
MKQVKNCTFSLLQFSKPSPIACLGDGEWRKTRIDYPISKDLECLDLQRLNKSKWKHTQHGCFPSRNIAENDKFICRNTSELLAVNIKLKDKLSIIAKENTSQFNIKLPLSDSPIKEDTASLMSHSTYNPQTDKVLQGKENRAKFYQEFQEEGKLIASSKENFQTEKDSFNVNQEEENKDIKYLQELKEVLTQQKNNKDDEPSLINSRLGKKQEQITESQSSNSLNLQQELAEQTAKIAQSKNQKLREEEKLKQEQEIQRQLDNQARLKKLQEENKQKAITKRKTRQLEPA